MNENLKAALKELRAAQMHIENADDPNYPKLDEIMGQLEDMIDE